MTQPLSFSSGSYIPSAASPSIIPYNPEATSQEKAIEKMAETAAISDDLFEKALNTYELQSEEKNSTIRELGEMNTKLQANLEAMEAKYQELQLLHSTLCQRIQRLDEAATTAQEEVASICLSVDDRQDQQHICEQAARMSRLVQMHPHARWHTFQDPEFNFSGTPPQYVTVLTAKLTPANRSHIQLPYPLKIFGEETRLDTKSIQGRVKDLGAEIHELQQLSEKKAL